MGQQGKGKKPPSCGGQRITLFAYALCIDRVYQQPGPGQEYLKRKDFQI